MRRLRRFWRSEFGASSIVEYSIVMPLCLFVIFFIFMLGFYLQHVAIVESACERGLMVAMKMYNDPASDSIYDFSSGTASEKSGFGGAGGSFDSMTTNPYRYWSKNYRSGEIKSAVEKYVKGAISASQLQITQKWTGTPRVTYSSSGGILGTSATITVTQEYTLIPIVSSHLLGKTTTTISSSAKMNVVNQTEFIRNADFVCDLLGEFKAVENVVTKISNALDKVTSFFTAGETG